MLTTLLSTLVLGEAPLAINKLRILQGTHVIALAPAPTGTRVVASMEDCTVRVMDASKGLTIMTLKGHPQPAYAVAYNPAGTLIATGDETARIWIWDAKTGKKLRECDRNMGHQRGIQALSFSKDGLSLASTGKDDVIIVWNVAKGKPSAKFLGKGANFYGATFNPMAMSLVTATLGEGARVYKLNSPNPLFSFKGHDGQGALDIAINKAGSVVVTAGKDSKATVWSLITKKKMGSLNGHEDFVVRTCISPNGRLAATSSSDRSVRVWSLGTFREVARINDQCFVGAPICFTGDGRFLVTATDSDAIQISTVTPSQGIGAGGRIPKVQRTSIVSKPLGTKKPPKK